MPKEVWKPTHRKAAQDLLTMFLNSMQKTGLPFRIETELHMRQLTRMSSNENLNMNSILIVLERMKDAGLSDLEDFEKLFWEHLSKAQKHRESYMAWWVFFIPIQATCDSSLVRAKAWNIYSLSFRLYPWKNLRSALGSKNLKKHFNSLSFERQKKIEYGSYLRVRTREFNMHAAWASVRLGFEALRGVIEFSHAFAHTSHSFPEDARCKTPHPSWAIAKKEGEQSEIISFRLESEEPEKRFQIDQTSFECIATFCSGFKKIPNKNSTKALCIDLFRLYSEAMDAKLNHNCFLRFWQIAEALSLTERYHGKSEITIERLSCFSRQLKVDGVNYKNLVFDLYRKRNRIVHKGETDIVDDDDINLLKILCDLGLRWLVSISNKLPTQDHVEYFYECVGKERPHLHALSTSVKQVLSYQKAYPVRPQALPKSLSSLVTKKASPAYEQKNDVPATRRPEKRTE